MTTVDRKHPTYRDLLAALQRFDDEALDMPIKICDNESRYSHAIFDYYHDFYSEDGPQIAFKQVDEIKDEDLIKYTVVEDGDGEILYQEKTYPEIVRLCKEENLTMKSFDKEPDAYGTFYAYVIDNN